MSEVTRILDRAQQGDAKAAEEFLPLVYEELRRLAARQMAREAPGQTLQPTALVHEAWLRIAGSDRQQWTSRGHFLGAAAEAMRRILIDKARRKNRVRHGREFTRVDLDNLDLAVSTSDETLLRVDEALDKLAGEDKTKAELVKLRYFAGLSIPEAAQALGLSETTAKRHWAYKYGNFCFSPDSRLMAGGCADHTVKAWDVATLNVRSVLRSATYVAGFSKDGRELLTSTKDGAPRWWNFQTQSARPIPGYSGEIGHVISVDLSPDRRTAALGLGSGEIQILDIDSGRPIGQPLRGHRGGVRSLAFSPGGETLASGGGDKTVMVWDVRSQRGLGMCLEHKGAVFGVAISPNGKFLASGCGAETIKVWTLGNVTAGSPVPSAIIPPQSGHSRFPPMDGRWPAAARTTPSSFGISPYAGKWPVSNTKPMCVWSPFRPMGMRWP